MSQQRCAGCGRFSGALVDGHRCSPCAGMLPLTWPTDPTPADEPAQLCAQLGAHDWDTDDSLPCPCSAPHPFRLCARCLAPDESDCEGLS